MMKIGALPLRTVACWCVVSGLATAAPAAGGLEAQTTGNTYQRAEQFLGRNARTLVFHDQVAPQWLDGDRFWYRDRTPKGEEFILVDPGARSRAPAFDHARLAAALSVAADTSYEPSKLPFQSFEFVDGVSIRFTVGDSLRWTCGILGPYTCTGPDTIPAPPRTEAKSPDGNWVAFTRDHNLWVRSTQSGEEAQLSTDGEPYYGYAVNDQCCNQVTAPRRDIQRPPVLRWSPDSRRIATHKLDQRGVGALHLLETSKGRPILHTYRYALPGDSIVPTFDLYAFDVASRGQIKIDLEPQQATNTSCCGLMIDTIWKDVQWGRGSAELFFTYGRRDYKTLDLFAADATTGATRSILQERSPTFVELRPVGGRPNWRVVNDNREVIWFSERDGWGHLYLFDALTGVLKNQMTSGPWVVVDLVRVDEQARVVYFTGVGREEGRDPYFRHLYRVAFDGSELRLLTPEDADHDIRVAPSGAYFVDTYSRRDTIPVTVVRGLDGRVSQTLEEGDVSQLLAAGWQWPVPFTVKARDGVTDLHGLLFFPSHFDPEEKYPVVDYVYPGPQVGPIGFRSFTVNARGNAHALAELGFIVFSIDAMGTPLRSKAFHDSYYGNMGDNGIPDHIVALRQLALRYPQMDLDRVGIFGHSGGGFASTDAILRYPDFFKVAVSSAGNHDNRSYDYTWGEKYQGLVEQKDDGTDGFDSQANQNLAENLKGKLLLMYGTLDDNVHPNATLLLINELIEHNKDFDLIVMPNRNHGYSNEPYVIRRTWDYFVRHLRGEEPPHQFKLSQEQRE